MKILVVDDEQLVRWFLDRTLRKSGYEVITAGNVPDASAKLSSESIDVLITDLRMPGEDGTALIGKVDARGKHPKVIVCSAFVTAELEEELRERDVCILRKPVALDELNEAVQICIEKEPARSTTKLLNIISDFYKASFQKKEEIPGKKERTTDRDKILADFQFYIDNNSGEIFGGITANISPHGLCFITRASVKTGQTITVTELRRKSTMPDFIGRQAKVIWVREGSHYNEAGINFSSAS